MCRDVTAEDGAPFCYAAMTMHLFETDNDIQITIKKVLDMVPREYQEDVMFSLMHTYLFSQDTQKEYGVYIRLCRNLPAYLSRDACVQAVAGGLFNNGTPTKEFVETTEFCASPYLIQREKSTCFQEALQLVKQTYGVESWRESCMQVDNEYTMYCVSQ
jgi:hypothetical protein